MSANKQSDIALKNSSEREKYFVGVQPNPANGLYQSNYIRCYFKTTRKELRCLVSAISANSATCLPHIVTENCFKILKNARNQVLKSGCFSVNFAQYSKLAEDFRLVQFPYGSPFNVLGNSVISPFPSFSFIPKIGFVRYLSAIAILQRTFLFYLVLSCGRKLNAPSIA